MRIGGQSLVRKFFTFGASNGTNLTCSRLVAKKRGLPNLVWWRGQTQKHVHELPEALASVATACGLATWFGGAITARGIDDRMDGLQILGK